MTQLLVEIYGKTGCPYCEKAKQICETRELKYNYYTLDREYSRETLLEMFPGARTVPQIRIGTTKIGGYEQLLRYLEETAYTGTGYSL